MAASNAGAQLLFDVSLVAAILVGVTAGVIRAWWFALLGLVVPVVMVLVSRFASNDPLAGSEDMSLRILFVVVAAEFAVLFFVAFAVGLGLRLVTDRLRHRGGLNPGSGSGSR
jgi:hypothetical protein